MQKCSNDNNPYCDYCGLIEDNLHLFTKCSRIKKIWTHYQPKLTKLIGKTDTPQQRLLTLNLENKNKSTRKLTLITIQIILFERWPSRNTTTNTTTHNNKQNKHTTTTHSTSTLQKTQTKRHMTSIQRSVLHK